MTHTTNLIATMTLNDLQALKTLIISELYTIYPDIHVTINYKYNTVHKVGPVKTGAGEYYYPYGVRSYVGMTEACIWVYWDKFFDAVCGNGWMYGQDRLFKFDIKDGDCKYCNEPTYLEDTINAFIERMKKEHAKLEANWKEHKQLQA